MKSLVILTAIFGAEPYANTVESGPSAAFEEGLCHFFQEIYRNTSLAFTADSFGLAVVRGGAQKGHSPYRFHTLFLD